MAIEFSNVSFKYNKISILDNISLTIDDNRITGIYGKNGSGKTTLANIISNVQLPSSGKIISMGYDISIRNFKYRKNIGYSKQGASSWFSNSVYGEISFILKNNKYSHEQIDYKLSELCLGLGLDKSFLNKKLSTLNNGEKRLLSIMSSVCYNPELIILDEPGAALDAYYKKKIISFIKSLKNDYKKTVIVVSSDIDFLIKIVDDLIIIDNCKIVTSGKKMDVISNVGIFRSCGLELPSIIDFSELVKEEKNKKIGYYDDVKDLMKAVYRNV